MKKTEEGVLLRIFVGEQDKYEGKPLYEAIVLKARELKMAGATVIRGVMGFGAHSLIHTTKLLRLSEDLPLVIEMVDREDRIDKFLPYLDEVVKEGLITLEKAHIVVYRPGKTFGKEG